MSEHVNQLTYGSVYLDTMVLYISLRSKDVEVTNLLQRIEEGALQAFTSALTFDEVAYRLLLGLIRDKYGKSPLDRLRQSRAEMIAEFYPIIEPQLVALQRFPHLDVVPVTAADLAGMHQNIRQFKLLPRDALHLSVMQRINCTNLISEDSDFDAVTDLNRFTLR